jgi:hypothetical protein
MQIRVRGDGNIIAELIAVGDVDEKSLDQERGMTRKLDPERIALSPEKMRERNLHIGPQSPFRLASELMGDTTVKAYSAQHTRKLPVNEKAIDPGGLAGENDIQGL